MTWSKSLRKVSRSPFDAAASAFVKCMGVKSFTQENRGPHLPWTDNSLLDVNCVKSLRSSYIG